MPEQNKNRGPQPTIILSVVMLAALITWPGCKKQPVEPTGRENQQEQSTPAEPDANSKAPDFTLTDIAEQKHQLSDYRGKNVLLIFWATWCPPCRMEIPHLIELRKTVSEEDLAILAVSNEKLELVKKFVTSQKMNYTVLLDEGAMPKPFGFMRIYTSTGVPGAFFIDPQGKIKLATSGLVSLPEIKAILQAESDYSR